MPNPCQLHTRGTVPGGRSAHFGVRAPVTREEPSLPTFSMPQVGPCDMGMITPSLTGLNEMMCRGAEQPAARDSCDQHKTSGMCSHARACARARVCAGLWSSGWECRRTGRRVASYPRWLTPEFDAEFKGKPECQGKGKGAWLIRRITKK